MSGLDFFLHHQISEVNKCIRWKEGDIIRTHPQCAVQRPGSLAGGWKRALFTRLPSPLMWVLFPTGFKTSSTFLLCPCVVCFGVEKSCWCTAFDDQHALFILSHSTKIYLHLHLSVRSKWFPCVWGSIPFQPFMSLSSPHQPPLIVKCTVWI